MSHARDIESVCSGTVGRRWWTLVLDDDDEDGEPGVDKNKKSTTMPEKSDDDDDNDKKSESSEEEEEGDEVGLHFDADYGLEAQVPNLLLHPRIASVTYLTSFGSPTVILDRTSPPPNDLEKKTLEGSVRKAWLSRPLQGKHLAFDGRLLHGAPSTFFPGMQNMTSTAEEKKSDAANGNADTADKEPPEKRTKVSDDGVFQNGTCSSTTKRMTLLVNIWLNHCPLDAEPVEDEIIEQLKTPLPSKKEHTPTGKTNGDDDEAATSATTKLPFAWNPSLNLAQPTTMAQVSLQSCPDDHAGSEEVVICGRLVTVNYGASMEDFHKAAQFADGSDMVELQLDPDVIALHVGGVVAEDDDDTKEE